MSSLPVIVNPSARSGGAGRDIQRALDALRRLGHDPVAVDAPDASGTTARIVDLVEAGADRIIVLGGDGMVQLAARVLSGTDVALGVIPSGTGNDFAAALAIPSDVDDAAACAVGPAHRIDLIRIDGDGRQTTWAASVATIGFAADVNQRANAMNHPRGASRYTIATMFELPRLSARSITFDIDGERHQMDATVVAIANTTSFGGGMLIAPLAQHDDGLLDVTVVGAVGRLRLLRFFRRVFDGSHLDLDEVEHHRGAAIVLTCPGARLWADGEPIGDVLDHRAITLSAAPGALLVASGAST